jgi:L-threonylcarbamoyladenylate synthase
MPLHLSINPDSFDLGALAPAVDALRRARAIVYPTDTLYGLGADPREPRAIEAVFRAKGRSAERALPLIAGSVEQACAVGQFSAAALRLVSTFWPGPLTVVVKQNVALADGVGRDGTVAVRVPDHAVARALALVFGFAITSTSANRSGAPPWTTPLDAAAALEGAIAVIVDAGPTTGGAPSTIVDLSSGAPRLIRAGAVAWERVLESLK